MKAWPVILFVLLMAACKGGRSESLPAVPVQQELLIYCENGMVGPILEISNFFESRYNCKVKIVNGNVTALIGSILISKHGDLFIPDSYAGILKLMEEKPDILEELLYIGNQRMVFIVPSGNPAGFDGLLSSLSDKKYAVMLANPEISSLGMETASLLNKEDRYRPTMTNVLSFSPDSRGLLRGIGQGDANVAIDWLSSYLYDNIRFQVDTLNILYNNITPEVHASVLSTSNQRGLAYSFLAMLTSPLGVEVLQKYGISKLKEPRLN